MTTFERLRTEAPRPRRLTTSPQNVPMSQRARIRPRSSSPCSPTVCALRCLLPDPWTASRLLGIPRINKSVFNFSSHKPGPTLHPQDHARAAHVDKRPGVQGAAVGMAQYPRGLQGEQAAGFGYRYQRGQWDQVRERTQPSPELSWGLLCRVAS